MEKLIIYLSIFCLFSCGPQPSGSFSNQEINKEVLNKVSSIENEFISNVKKRDYESCKKILAGSFPTGNNFSDYLDNYSNLLQDAGTTLVDQYYIINSAPKELTIVSNSTADDDGYYLSFTPTNAEAFVSVWKINSEPFQWLIISIYTKYNDEWKLDFMDGNRYSYKQLNAEELYEKASKFYEEENYLDAWVTMQYCLQLTMLESEIFGYKQEEEFNAFYKKVAEAAGSNYQFPIAFDEVETKPELLYFQPRYTDEGISPMFTFLTKIQLSDSLQLLNEKNEIHQSIEYLFPELTSNNEVILYQMINKMPTDDETVNGYYFIERTGKDN